MPRFTAFGILLPTLAALMLAGPSGASVEYSTKSGEWRTFGGDLANTRYSPLDQINATNFSKLRVAWRLRSEMFGPEFNWQTTPLMVGGVLYTTIGAQRHVVAVEAATGQLLWMYRTPDEGQRGVNAPRPGSGRGLAYWSDGKNDERILYVTIGYNLISLDAKTGLPAPAFGARGVVDLKQQLDQVIDPVTSDIGWRAAPVVARDLVIVGAAHDNTAQSRINVKGYIRAYDVRSGKLLWTFRTIPSPGEFGNETWGGDSWSYTGNTGVWGQISVDEELGMVYLPTESATNDYYGGHRPPGKGPEANLFENSIVAVDLKTGKRIWHQQLIHHGIWDWDLPCAPILADITVGGRPVKAIAQPSKQAFLYVYDRQTGQPIWPIEERPVPQSDVPGEKTSPTQPFPTKPPAYDRQGISTDDLIDFTPELRAEALKVASQYKLGPLFTPPIVARENGPKGLLMVPYSDGGTNWAGGSYDPETGVVYLPSHTAVRALTLIHDPKRPDLNFVDAGGGGGTQPLVQGIPIVKPPWSRITAIDLNKGDILWQRPHGETPDTVRDSPALKGITVPPTGGGSRHMSMVTKTLVIAGERLFYDTPQGRGARLRAYDKKTGDLVGDVLMPAPQTGGPMTYMVKNKQYLVVAVGGRNVAGELIAYALPQ